jgi:hypothetical protein
MNPDAEIVPLIASTIVVESSATILPLKEAAVTVPVKIPLPLTSNFSAGLKVPTPRSFVELKTTYSDSSTPIPKELVVRSHLWIDLQITY